MSARLQVRFTLEDREGQAATLTFWLDPSVTNGALLSFINMAADKIRALTDARLAKCYTYLRHVLDGVSDPGNESDVNRLVVLYYSNGDIIESIWIPSPLEALFEATGDYQGIRVDATHTALFPWTDDAPTFLSLLTTPEGEPFPNTFIVGGKAL